MPSFDIPGLRQVRAALGADSHGRREDAKLTSDAAIEAPADAPPGFHWRKTIHAKWLTAPILLTLDHLNDHWVDRQRINVSY